jgi:hypothetical protein
MNPGNQATYYAQLPLMGTAKERMPPEARREPPPHVQPRGRIQERTAWSLLWEHLEGHDIGSQVGLHPVLAGLRVNLNRFLRA